MIWLRAVFFVVAVQLTVIGVIPCLLARVGPRLSMGLWHWLGIVPLAIGSLALLWCNWAFVVRGRGTAAPYDPPRALVVQGLYRHVRNPMYVSALLIVLGIALWTGATSLFGYSLILALSYHLFVRYYEEPHLRRVFGHSYEEYCAGVRRWWPRVTPWMAQHQPELSSSVSR
jgi:protein-S-isoprenylcysteine O-methyltransferase Ste14